MRRARGRCVALSTASPLLSLHLSILAIAVATIVPTTTALFNKMMGEEVTTDWLKKELETTEKRLTRNDERKRQRNNNDLTTKASPLQRLFELNDEVDCLELAQDLTAWTSTDEQLNVMEETQHCINLGKILCKNVVPPANTKARRFYDTLLTQEYQPLHHYVRSSLVMALRRSLREVGYPSEEACSQLQTECQDVDATKDTSFAAYCFWLSRLQKANNLLKAHISGNANPPTERSDVIVELCKPLVERVRFHFAEQSADRLTSKRIERLPEWVLSYIKEHAFEGGPWDLVEGGIVKIVDDAPFQFANEMVQLAQYVLEERNFSRCAVVAGPNSNPLHLTQGIEQLLLFDRYIRDVLSEQQRVPVGLSQTLIVSDADLWKWFLNREREATLSTMFDTGRTERPLNRISPSSELFCALIYSIRSKTSLFETPGPYLSHVAVPLCMNYLDAVHTTSTDLRNLLSQRKLPSDKDLNNNMEMWIELINGTQAAAMSLLKGNASQFGPVSLPKGITAGDHDLARVGRSFERLREVLVDECATTIVETLLMERARLASYLMRCSHVLANRDVVDNKGLSPDLYDVANIFSLFIEKCNETDGFGDELDQFAPAAIRLNVIDRLADKFLEVALDAHGMTPDLVLQGCLVVAEDVKILFSSLRSSLADRLFDVTAFMTMDNKNMRGLRMALFGLSQSPNAPEEPPLLNFAQFASDGTLLDEATSMIRAKGYGVHLEDAISVLNRRRDSF